MAPCIHQDVPWFHAFSSAVIHLRQILLFSLQSPDSWILMLQIRKHGLPFRIAHDDRILQASVQKMHQKNNAYVSSFALFLS